MQKMESTEKNSAARAATKAAEIAEEMMLGKATIEKLEAIEDNDKRVEAVGNITKPRMAAMLVRVQTDKDTFRLDFIVALNSLGVLKNGAVVGG